MSLHHSTSPVINGATVAQPSALLQKALVIMLGIFIIGVVGFSHIDVCASLNIEAAPKVLLR